MIYKGTATKSKTGTVYAFGRKDSLDGKSTSLGGYVVFALSSNYDGAVRDGVRKSWLAVEQNLTYRDAVKLMNQRVGFKAFTVPSSGSSR